MNCDGTASLLWMFLWEFTGSGLAAGGDNRGGAVMI